MQRQPVESASSSSSQSSGVHMIRGLCCSIRHAVGFGGCPAPTAAGLRHTTGLLLGCNGVSITCQHMRSAATGAVGRYPSAALAAGPQRRRCIPQALRTRSAAASAATAPRRPAAALHLQGVGAAILLQPVASNRMSVCRPATGDAGDSPTSNSSDDSSSSSRKKPVKGGTGGTSSSSSNEQGSGAIKPPHEPVAAVGAAAPAPAPARNDSFGSSGSSSLNSSSSSSSGSSLNSRGSSASRAPTAGLATGPRRPQRYGPRASFARTVPAPPKQQQESMLSSSASGSSNGSSNSVGGSSNGSSSTAGGSSNGSSAPLVPPQSEQWCQRGLSSFDLETIKQHGPQALSGFAAWAHKQPNPWPQGDWEMARVQLRNALEQLLAVSRSGPVKLVFFDIETTGRGDDNALEILELAAATGHPGDREQTFPAPGQDALIRPLGEISLGASDTHKMFNRQLVDKPPVPVVLLNWVNWLTRQCKDTEGGSCTLVLAGHNIASFDSRWVAKWLDVLCADPTDKLLVRDVKQAKELGWYAYNPQLPWLCFDTLKLARAVNPPPPKKSGAKSKAKSKSDTTSSNSQQTLRRRFGIRPGAVAHRALEDVLVNVELFRRLAEWRLELADSSGMSLEHLLLRLPKSDLAPLLQQKQQQQVPLLHKQQPGRQQEQQALPPPLPQPPPPQKQQQQQPLPPPLPPVLKQQQQELLPPPLPSQPQQQQQQEQQEHSPHLNVIVQQLEAAAEPLQSLLQQLPHGADKEKLQPLLPPLQQLLQSYLQQQEKQQETQEQAATTASVSAPAQPGKWCSDTELDAAALIWSKERGFVSDNLSLLGSSSSSSSVLSDSDGSSAAMSSSSRSNSSSNSSSTRTTPGSRSSSGSSGLRGGRLSASGLLPAGSISISLESTITDAEREEAEEAVAVGLASLSKQDLRWDPQELQRALPLLADPLNPKDKVFSPGLYKKLAESGLEGLTHMQLLTYTPTVTQYSSSIPIAAAGGGSSSAASAAVHLADLAGDSTEQDGESSSSEESQDAADSVVFLAAGCKCLYVRKPGYAASKGAYWSALLEVPTDPPSAGPAHLAVKFFIPGKSSFFAMQQANAEAAKARQAMEDGSTVFFKGRVKPWVSSSSSQSFWQPAPPEGTPCWDSVSGPSVSWDGTSSSAAEADADGSSSSTDEDGVVVDRGTTSTTTSSTSISSVDAAGGSSVAGGDGFSGSLFAVYRKLKEVLPGDWAGSGRSRGIIPPLLDKVRSELGSTDFLPPDLRQQYGVSDWADDLAGVHRPSTPEQYAAACRGLAFRELVLMQVAQFLERYRLSLASDSGIAAAAQQLYPHTESTAPRSSSGSGGGRVRAPPSDRQEKRPAPRQPERSSAGAAAYCISGPEVASVVATAKSLLPYQLTAGQEKALAEVLGDMQGPQAMQRLLQGDVGCGKTAVALLACLASTASGHQALLFAPTELLATQHLQTLENLAECMSFTLRPRTGLLTGNMTAKAKNELKRQIAAGEKNLIISTHAALFITGWNKLGLVVIDEQHKLGVKQRERIIRELPVPPHMLLMTATPIPRTLAIMQFGGMDLSTISELPPGRTPVATRVVPDDEPGREEVYSAIRKEIAGTGCVYIVCPLVGEASSSDSSSKAADSDVKTVTAEYERLSSSGLFGEGTQVAMLHGGMDAAKKSDVLRNFRNGTARVLIASTVVEVGVDVPDATVMLVEGAHRFGLAQLHQLRGRVGRGHMASKCFLMAPAPDAPRAAEATARLKVMEESHNGLKIAEADLRIRGFGDLWSGTKQSGKNSQLSSFTMQALESDVDIILKARHAAGVLLQSISTNPTLKAALLASGIMVLQQGQRLPVARDGISGI